MPNKKQRQRTAQQRILDNIRRESIERLIELHSVEELTEEEQTEFEQLCEEFPEVVTRGFTTDEESEQSATESEKVES